MALALPRTVSASAGWTAPRVAVKVTTVPSWTGVPANSTTRAVTWVEPPVGRIVSAATRLSVDCEGATSDVASHARHAAATRHGT